MKSRAARLLTLLSLLVAPLVVASSTQPAKAADPQYCDEGKVAPCIVTAKRDGVDVVRSVYQVSVDTYTPPDDLHETGFTITKAGVSPYGLGADELTHSFEVTMNTGTIVPRVVDGLGIDGSTQRWFADGHWNVRITVKPADMLAGCYFDVGVGDTVCPTTATSENVRQYINMRVSDATWYSTIESEKDTLYGLESYSNIELFWYPPNITVSPAGVVQMDFLMQNSHEYADGTDFIGSAKMRIPNRTMRGLYGIPNPDTMVDGSFTSTTTSGSVSSEQDLADSSWRINLTGATFSEQHLRLKRGVIVPTRPTNLVATRIDAHTGKVAFTKATARGALPTGYKIRCVSGGGHVVTNTKTTPTSPIRIGGLRRGVGYDCRVRATSKAGLGTWSIVERMPARP